MDYIYIHKNNSLTNLQTPLPDEDHDMLLKASEKDPKL